MPTVLITGGTGLIGKALTGELLKRGHQVIVVSRGDHRSDRSGLSFARWNIEKQEMDPRALAEADFIVHLAGAGLAEKRWTEKRKKEIVDSRVRSGQLIVRYLKDFPNKVRAVISSSAIGLYGEDRRWPRTDRFTEESPPAEDFIGNTCRLWEESVAGVASLGKRLVILRTGVVLDRDEGALAEFSKPLNFGIAGIAGTGQQVVSWIHVDDIARLYAEALDNEKLSGVYNAVAPFPVRNKDLVLKLAVRKRGKIFIPVHVPGFAIRILFGAFSEEVLKSATVSSAKVQQEGFSFTFPVIDKALDDLVAK